MDGARRLVEGLAELAAVGIGEQRIERPIVGEGAAGRDAAGGKRRRAGEAAQEGAAVIPGGGAVARSIHDAKICKSIAAEFGRAAPQPH